MPWRNPDFQTPVLAFLLVLEFPQDQYLNSRSVRHYPMALMWRHHARHRRHH